MWKIWGVKPIKPRDGLNIFNLLFISLKNNISQHLKDYLENKKNEEEKRLLARHYYLLNLPDSQGIGSSSYYELGAGIQTMFRFFFNILRIIVKKYKEKYSTDIQAEDLTHILKNAEPLFLILAKNNMNVHSGMQDESFLFSSKNWEIVEGWGKNMFITLNDNFWLNANRIIKEYDEEIKRHRPEQVYRIATGCPALFTMSKDKNVIISMYKMLIRVVEIAYPEILKYSEGV